MVLLIHALTSKAMQPHRKFSHGWIITFHKKQGCDHLSMSSIKTMAVKSVAFIDNNEGESMWSDIFVLDNIFFRDCVTDVVVPSYVVGFIYIYIYTYWDSLVLFLSLLCSFMMCAHNRVYYGLMVVLVYLHITLPHYHHYADVLEGVELLRCLSCTFCRVCVYG